MIKKIKLDLFKLKSKKDLNSIYQFFKKSTGKWFNDNKSPKDEFFKIKKCPLCNNDTSKEAFKIDSFSYHECSYCDSLYTKPHLRDGVLDSLYNDGTYQVYQDNLVIKGKKIRKNILEKRKFFQIKNFINKSSNPTLLDIGCGSGTFLDVCKQNGWQVEGADLSLSASKSVLENYNIEVYQGDFNKIKFNKTFDVITLWGVLEHLSDPITTIKKAKELLKNDGMLVFEVPSADCFISEYLKKNNFSPTRYLESGRHNIFFSKKFLIQIAENFNLKIEYLETNGFDIQTILLEEFEDEITDKIINIQDILNDLLLGDHYRIFLRK
jgi:2-polyprenyl-3-methyl-5-hydroxy-6-metoxy-1,4-benzoquinol methylase